MDGLQAYPFLRYVLYLMLGILLAYNQVIIAHIGYLLTGLFSLLLLIGYWVQKGWFRGRNWFSLIGAVFLILLGYWRYQTHEQHLKTGLQEYGGAIRAFVFVLEEPLEARARSWRLNGRIVALRDSLDWKLHERKLRLYLPLTDSVSLFPGDQLLVKANLRRIRSNKNPYAFDYAAYAALQHVYLQAYSRDYQILSSKTLSWQDRLQRFRQAAVGRFHAFLPQPTAGILAALVLGYRQGVGEDVKTEFSETGTLHILAVSGLHVGLWYGLLITLFGVYRHRKLGRFTFPILCGISLLAYAALTGFTPSVMRAGLMFWLFSLADAMQRGRNRLNTLALSAFILLLVDPHTLLMPGFQLSYAAVLGILLLVPRFTAVLPPKPRIIYRSGQLLAVTLAAQLATFPLSLYYFGQFPTYFFLANLLVVPLAALMLYGGISLLLLSVSLPILAAWLAKLVHLLVSSLLFYMQLLRSLPSHSFQVYASLVESLLLYAGIALIFISWRLRRHWLLALSCLPFLLIAGLVYLRVQENQRQKVFIVYQQEGNSLLHFIAGRKDALYTTVEQSESAAFAYEPVRRRLRLPDKHPLAGTSFMRPVPWGQIWHWQNLKIVRMERVPKQRLPQEPLKVDVLIISENAVQEAEAALAYFQPKQIVLDGSNSNFWRFRLAKNFRSLNFEVHDTAQQGAFIFSL